MKKFIFFILFFSSGVSFADLSSTVIELKADKFNFVNEGWEGSANSRMRYEAANRFCKTLVSAHGFPVQIPEQKSKLVPFIFSKKALMTPANEGGGFCMYKPKSAIVFLTGTTSDGSQSLVTQLEIYSNTTQRTVEIFCKISLADGREYLRCRNANESYVEGALRISLNLSAGNSTILVYQE